MYHVASTPVLLVLMAGILLRRRRRIHVPMMVAAFSLDLLTVLALEWNRGAVKKATSSPSPLLLFHVTRSTP